MYSWKSYEDLHNSIKKICTELKMNEEVYLEGMLEGANDTFGWNTPGEFVGSVYAALKRILKRREKLPFSIIHSVEFELKKLDEAQEAYDRYWEELRDFYTWEDFKSLHCNIKVLSLELKMKGEVDFAEMLENLNSHFGETSPVNYMWDSWSLLQKILEKSDELPSSVTDLVVFELKSIRKIYKAAEKEVNRRHGFPVT